jgi:hypothetical protein
MSLPFDRFSFEVIENQSPRISFSAGFADTPEVWRFELLHHPSGHHRLAVAVRT